ncbi:hypothetical protein HGG75_04820 [Ochrobactrum pseudogrignonense]|nr:hypothetical protein [Brucella pseudogrignonensis]
MTRQLSRRLFLAGTSAAASAGIVGTANAQVASGGAATVSVQEALKQRRSTKRFGRGDVAREKVLEALWAANGVNRADGDGRTAPARHGAKNVDIYVALEDGVSLYDPVANALNKVADTDIRADVSPTAFVRRAPVVLIYVSDAEKLAAAAGDRQVCARRTGYRRTRQLSHHGPERLSVLRCRRARHMPPRYGGPRSY